MCVGVRWVLGRDEHARQRASYAIHAAKYMLQAVGKTILAKAARTSRQAGGWHSRQAGGHCRGQVGGLEVMQAAGRQAPCRIALPSGGRANLQADWRLIRQAGS